MNDFGAVADILFVAFGLLAIVPAFFVVLSKNVLHSAVALLFCLLGVASLYVLLGADFYETLEEMRVAESDGRPPIGIGADSLIEGAIVDKNARIGRGVRIQGGSGPREDRNGEGYFVRDGVVVVPKGAVIPDGAVV